MKDVNGLIANRIKKLRNEKRIPQSELAQKLNITISAYNRIENNRTQLSVNMLFAIAMVLKIPVLQLVAPTEKVVQQNTHLVTTNFDDNGIHVHINIDHMRLKFPN